MNRTPPPPIAPVPSGAPRPFWSVMIPTYRPGPSLEQTLRSVLDQDPGPDRMQIAVVDDGSPDRDPEELVRRLAPGRVELYRPPRNVGLARYWNGSIERARGHWVHLLHQDDHVLPGFYDRMAQADAGPNVGAGFCRHRFVDGAGVEHDQSRVHRPTAGVLAGWLATIARMQRVQCPAMVVRRSSYERVGGFRLDLIYALDWEMWVRLASRFDCWYEPEPLASYRIHPGNETARLKRDDRDLRDVRRAIRIIRRSVPAEVAPLVGGDLMTFFRDEAVFAMYGQLGRSDARGALRSLRRAARADRSWAFRRRSLAPLAWALKILIRGGTGLRGPANPA